MSDLDRDFRKSLLNVEMLSKTSSIRGLVSDMPNLEVEMLDDAVRDAVVALRLFLLSGADNIEHGRTEIRTETATAEATAFAQTEVWAADGVWSAICLHWLMPLLNALWLLLGWNWLVWLSSRCFRQGAWHSDIDVKTVFEEAVARVEFSPEVSIRRNVCPHLPLPDGGIHDRHVEFVTSTPSVVPDPEARIMERIHHALRQHDGTAHGMPYLVLDEHEYREVMEYHRGLPIGFIPEHLLGLTPVVLGVNAITPDRSHRE